MKILITGSTGLLGSALSKRLAQDADVVGVSRHERAQASGGAHVVCDLLDAKATAALVRRVSPGVVIHTQALSDVDRCEQEPELAEAMNVETTAHLIEASAGLKCLFVYISTDYVFDGRKEGAYDESDAPNPLSVYGKSKRAGERLALDCPGGLVVRVSTLFGSARMNFCDYIVSRLRAGQPVEAFRDQTTSPTYTEDVAEAMGPLIQVTLRQGGPAQIFHVVNEGGCTRVEFAQHLAQVLGAPASAIQQIRMADQRRPAPRPPYSALMTRYVPQVIGRTLRPWQSAVQAYLQERHWLN